MDTLEMAKHELERSEVSERILRIKSLELALQHVPRNDTEVVLRSAKVFLNFMLGIDEAK